MPTFDTPGPIDLDVTVGMGLVELIASDRADTVVEVVPANPRRSGDVSLAGEATVAFADGRVRVKVPKRLNLFGPGDSVDVRVNLPTGSRATVENAYGSIRARGVLGDSRITAAYGTVTMDTTGDLALKAPYGDVEIEEVAGDLDLVAGHAKLRIGRVGGDARVKGSHGILDFGEIAGELEARTSGAVSVGRAGGSVSVQTAHGAIRVREARSGTIRLENGYAEVSVGVPKGVAAWVDAASQHGVVRNELTPDAGPEGADSTVELRLRNNYGDIIISRTPQGGTK
ncbi:DUF4097 family beta strand repeat-containing protein [soil metagenome]